MLLALRPFLPRACLASGRRKSLSSFAYYIMELHVGLFLSLAV